MAVEKNFIKEAALQSKVLDVGADFLTPEFRRKCEEIIPLPCEIPSKDFRTAYLH